MSDRSISRCIACLLAASLTLLHPSLTSASDSHGQLRVERTRVNVRADPTLKARVLYQVSQGAVLKSLGRNGEWYEIEDASGRRGYIYSALVSPIVEPKKLADGRNEEHHDIQALEEDSVSIVRPGPSTKTLLIGGGIALVGITALLLASRGDESKTTDSDGDGFTPGQGDCNDAVFEVNPNGSVTTTVSSNVAGQSVDCATDSTWRVFVTNNSCSEVTVRELRVDRSVLEQSGGVDCSIFGSTRMTPHQSVVPPGSTVTVLETNATAACCDDPGACSGFCRFRSIYTADTSVGRLTTTPIQHHNRYGSQCSRCSSTVY